MSVLLLALVLSDAPARLDGLPALGTAATARLVPQTRAPAPPGPQCRFTRHTFADARVPLMWAAQCFDAQAWTLGHHDGTVVVPLLRQQGNQTWLAFNATTAEEFDRWGKPPAWVPVLAHQRAQGAEAAGLPGFVVLAHDGRDGTVLGHSHERGYLRVKSDPRTGITPTPLFEGALPPETNTPRVALTFDVDPRVKAPWLVYAPDPWRNGELRVRAPWGVEETLLRLPPRQHGGNYRVDSVRALRIGTRERPIVTAIVDGAHLLFTPIAQRGEGIAGGTWAARALQAVPYPPVRPPPSGARVTPPCADAVLTEDTEQHFDPQLFEHRGRAFLAWVSEDTRSRLRFGVVPRDGATPADDRLSCDWITDARVAERSLVIAEVTDDGQLREHLRVAVQQQGYGSVLVLEREQDKLHVVTGSRGLVSWAVIDLAKALPR